MLSIWRIVQNALASKSIQSDEKNYRKEGKLSTLFLIRLPIPSERATNNPINDGNQQREVFSSFFQIEKNNEDLTQRWIQWAKSSSFHPSHRPRVANNRSSEFLQGGTYAHSKLSGYCSKNPLRFIASLDSLKVVQTWTIEFNSPILDPKGYVINFLGGICNVN